ncbi:MAG: hypothetical protein EBR28_05855 [Planctomycetia bacterium]|nr:hypothetical protein [Planctomycetia bacterium]
MPSTTNSGEYRPTTSVTIPHVLRIGGEECVVRALPLCPIADVLGFEHEIAGPVPADIGTIADLLDSRMIAPPRPRRRRDRAVSSRAVFYAAE